MDLKEMEFKGVARVLGNKPSVFTREYLDQMSEY